VIKSHPSSPAACLSLLCSLSRLSSCVRACVRACAGVGMCVWQMCSWRDADGS
jgi:hypothetical protein